MSNKCVWAILPEGKAETGCGKKLAADNNAPFCGYCGKSKERVIKFNNNRLAPCPFCESPCVALHSHESDYDGNKIYVTCSACGAESSSYPSMERARLAWNNLSSRANVDEDFYRKVLHNAVEIAINAGALLSSNSIQVKDSQDLTQRIMIWAEDFEKAYQETGDYLEEVDEYAKVVLLDKYGPFGDRHGSKEALKKRAPRNKKEKKS